MLKYKNGKWQIGLCVISRPLSFLGYITSLTAENNTYTRLGLQCQTPV